MTRSDRYRILLVSVALLLAARAQDAAARQEFAWSRATVGLLAHDGPIGESRAQELRDAGIDAVVWPGTAADESGWSAVADGARESGLRILLGLEDAVGEDSVLGLAIRAVEAGFDGIVTSDPHVRSSLDRSAFEGFVVVSGDDGADVVIERLASLPDSDAGLETLYARRARSIEDPTAAGLAVPAGPVDAHWLLLPGPVAVPEAHLADPAWQTVARFRSRHPALADGVHAKLSDEPYAFYRGMRLDRGLEDVVLVVVGAEGRIRLNVSSIFPDNVVLRDAVSGTIALVSFGQLSMTAGSGGLVLLELVY
jgi:hypothetical protein